MHAQIGILSTGLDKSNAEAVYNDFLQALFPGEKLRRKTQADEAEEDMRKIMNQPFEVTVQHGTPTVIMPKIDELPEIK